MYTVPLYYIGVNINEENEAVPTGSRHHLYANVWNGAVYIVGIYHFLPQFRVRTRIMPIWVWQARLITRSNPRETLQSITAMPIVGDLAAASACIGWVVRTMYRRRRLPSTWHFC